MTMYSRLLSMQFHSFQRRLRFVVEVYVRIYSPTDVWILGKYLRIHVEPNIQLRVSSGRYATIHSEQPNGREQMRGQKQQCVFECRNGKCAPAPPPAHNVRNEHQPTIRLVTLLSFSLRSPSPSLLCLGSVVPYFDGHSCALPLTEHRHYGRQPNDTQPQCIKCKYKYDTNTILPD